MAEITVDVGVRLKAMQSSVADLQKVLDGLQPNSSGFKALQRIIADINRDMDRLRIQTSKPFGSQNQFNQTEKTVDKLEESLEKVKITIDRIKFSDLKLDSSQTAQLDNFKQQLKDIKQEFTTFKADLKGQFLDNDFNKAFVEGINPNLINKNFDEIVKNVNSKVDSLGLALAKAKTELENFQNAAKIGEKIDQIPDEGLVSQVGLGENFKKFFQINSKGVFGFKTGGGLQKGEIKQQFIKYLTEEFQLTEGQIKQLQDQTTAKAIRDLLSNKDFFNTQLNAATNANKKMNGAESTFTTASKNYENAAAVVARLAPLLSALSNEEISLEDKQKLVNQAIREFEQECVKGAKGSKTMDTALNGLDSQLSSFKNQLGQVNAQWLNLQKQQATFNSMKSAIVNFMGFNQVLNITKKAVKEAMDHIKQLDTVMNGIAIVTDMTTADLWNQVDVYSEMAQRYGTSIQGAYEVSKIYYQAGYETNEVLTLMNETLKMSKISGLDYATTTDYMMNAIKGFKMEVADAAAVVDVYSALAANTAVSQQELAEAMSKTASSMAGVGSTFEDTSAMIATMVSVTRESANNIGSAMKSIASRYGELTKDPTKLLDSEGEAMSFNKVDTALKSVGITLQTTDHQFRDFTDVIVELADKWDTLDSAQQRYIATQFAGNRQQNRFLALVSNKDLLQENMDVAAASEDTGTLQALKALDSLETKLNQVQVAYQQFYTTIGAEGVWKSTLDGIKNFIDSLNNLPKLFGKIPIGAISVIVDVISVIKGLALSGLTEIASIWQQTIKKADTKIEGQKKGEDFISGMLSGIKSRAEEIQTAIENTTKINQGKELEKQGKELLDFSKQGQFSEVNGGALYQSGAGFIQTNEQFDNLINKLLQIQAITPEVAASLQQSFKTGDYEVVAESLNKIKIAAEEAGQKALEAGQKAQQGAYGFKGFVENSQHLASDLGALGSALNMVGSLINTTSRQGQIASGSIQLLAGGFKAAQTATLAFQAAAGNAQWSNVFTAAAGAVLVLVNAISTLYETSEEKLERLKKEAEDSKNTYIIKKDDLKNFDNAIKKYEELEKKQYDGAEAKEAFLKSSNDIAEQFPELISGYDAEGNAIVDLTNKYELLALKRSEAAKAGLENANKNYELITQQSFNDEFDIRQQARKLQIKDTIAASNSQSNINGAILTDVGKTLFGNEWLGNPSGYLSSFAAMNGVNFVTEDFNPEAPVESLDKLLKQFKEEFEGETLDFSTSNFTDEIQKAINNWLSEEGDLSFSQYLQENNLWSEEIKQNILGQGDEITQYYNSLANVTASSDTAHTVEEIFDAATQALNNYDAALNKLLEQTLNGEITSDEYDTFVEDNSSNLDYLKSITSSYASLRSSLNQKTAARKQVIAAQVYSDYVKAINDGEEADKQQWDYYEKSAEGIQLLNNLLDSAYNEGNYKTPDAFIRSGKYEEVLSSFNKSFGTFWNGASDSTREAFNIYYNNLGNYTREQAEQMATNMGLDFEATGLAKSWKDSDVTQRIRDALKTRKSNENLAMLREAGNLDFIPSVLEEQFKSVADTVNGYSREGLIANAHDLGVNYVKLVETIQKNAGENSSEIASLLSDTDLSFSGINELKEILSKEYQIDDGPIIEALDGVSNTLVENITVQIASLQEDINSNLKDVTNNLEKMGSGLEYSDALSIFEKIRSKNENINFTDLFSFDLDLGKYVANSADTIQKYLNAEEAVLRDNEEHITTVLEAANNFINPYLTTKRWQEKFGQEGYRETVVELGLQTYIDEIEAAQKSIDENDTSENQQRLFKAIENYNKAWKLAVDKNTADLTAASEALGNVTSASQLESLLNTQEYDKYLKIIGANTNTKDFIAAGDKSIAGSKAFFNQINSVYDSLISDVLSKDFENIHLEDYKDLIKGDDTAIKEAIQTGNYSYEQFIRDYGYLTSKSTEEINSLIIQAIEKDTQKTTGAAAEAVGKIQWLSDKNGFASLDDIQSLADALGISVDAILGEYNKQLDMYLVDLSNVEGVDLSAIDGFSDTVKDSINAFLKQIFENVNKAITGKLTNADVTTLTGQLEQLGLKDITLDSTQTVDGLKLSQRSAIELYNELKKIDALQAQLVFDELAKSLEASDTNYTNISTTLARIAELEKAIKEMKPDDARLQMYKNELAVAQEIARTRSSTDNKDFNFMDRALPTGMQNPIDYWNATGEAYKVMNASAKSGYMEIQDFYNIVQEMNNMAQSSGQTLHFMGQEIDGSAETAAALIQRGFSALTNVKGDGVKIALGNIGADFKTGAADMKGDFDSGIKEMAKSQIQMLDAAINMLEAIVAMENIDTSGEGILDFDELFNGGNAADGWTKPAEAWFEKLDNLTGGIEVGGVDLKTALLNMAQSGKDGAERVKQFMNDLKNIDWTLGDVNVAEKVHQLVQGLFVGQDITQGTSIFEVLKVPKNAEKTTEEFKDWVKETGLAAEEADTLIRILKNGYNISETRTDGKRNKYAEAIEKLLGLEKENQKTKFEEFTKGEKITQEEITLFSELNINWDEDGNITDATYTASDGSKLPLDKNNPSTWQDAIAERERKITIGQHTGQTTDKITDNSKLESIVLKSGLTVQGVISATSGGYTASYNGVTSPTFKSEDEARQWLYDLVNEKDKEKRSGGAYNPELVTDEVTGETKIKYNYRYILEPGTNKEDLVEPAKGVKQLDFKKDILPKIFKTGEKGEDGNFTYSLDDIGLTGMKITSKPGEIEQVLNDSLDDIIGETDPFAGLPEKIAEGITTAFTQDTSIADAIGTGIKTALTTGTDENGQPEEIPLPTLTLKPESITIQADEITPTITGINENNNLPIPSIAIEAQNVLLTSTIEPNIDGLNIPTSIPKEDLSVIYSALNLIGYKENVNESGVYLPAILEKHPVVAAYLAMLLLMSNSDTNYNETFVNNPSENLKKKFEAAAILAKLVLSSDENTDFIEGSISVGEGKQLKIKQVLEAIATGKIKINSPKNGSSIEQGNIIIGEGENQLTLSQIEWTTAIDAIKAELGLNYQVIKTGVTLTEDDLTLNPKELIQPISGIRYTNNFQKSREKVGLNNDWGSIDKNNKLGKDLVTSKNNDYLNYLEETAKYVGKGGILTSVDWTYLNPLKEMSDVTIPESVLTTLQSIDGLDLTNVKLENSQDLFNLLVQLQQFNESNSSSFSSVTDSLNALEIGELPEIATALQDIVTQAEILQGINWDKIVKGITDITNAQTSGGPTPTPTPTPAPSSGSDNSGNGGKVDLLDTSSLSVAVGEINSTISTISEAFSKSKDEINNIASAINEIKTDKINDIKTAQEAIGNDKVVAIQTAQENIGTGKIEAVKNAINSLGGTISLGVNVGVSVTGEGNAKGNIKSVSVSQGSVTRTENSAHWTQKKAYATGNTLMGELGPELVVSHGHYFVVGQNGPEMVNLAEDAIVFNHLQTQQLLKHGKASGHATPVTNERNATSLATGNAGPAMASASAALSALKQLRSMWQSLLNASLKDLGGLAGGSGGGGGGGGGDDATKGVLGNIERWYNYLQLIESTQVKINKLTKEYTLLEKQGASSNTRLDNLKEEYKLLKENKENREKLIEEQTKYRGKLLEQVQTGKGKYGLLSAFYDGNPEDGTFTLKSDKAFQEFVKKRGAGKTLKKGVKVTQRAFYTEEEAEKYNKKYEDEIKKGTKKAKKAGDVKKKGSKSVKFKATSGLELFDELQKTDQYGNLVYSADDQLKILEDLGFGEYLKKDASGNKLKTAEEKVEYFFNQIDSGKGEIDALTNSINEQEEASQDDAIAMQEINEQIRELAKPVTGITDGLEEWYNELQRIEKTERNINKLAKERSLLENDHIANGHEIYQNITEQRKQRESELKEYKELIASQKTERDNLLVNKINQKAREALGINYDKTTGVATFGKLGNIQKSSVSLDYEDVDRFNGYELDTQGNYVDKNGQLRNKDKGDQIIEGSFGELKTKIVKTNKNYSLEGKTIDELIKDITKQNADGSVAMNAQQQYNTLIAAGLEEFMQYDEQGNKLYQDFGALDNKETQAKMVEAGIKRIQSAIDELNESGKTIDENEEKALDIENALLEAENELRQKSIDLENAVKDAIVQEHQDVIDEKKELTDAMKDAADKAISGLKDSLDKEKQTYDADTDNKELEVMQAQLATLRLSNGSQSKIQDLAKQIQDKQKDIYFKERELAIDELEDAANKQIDALNAQTDLMQSVLDHQVEYGLIWEEVQDKMSGVNAKELASYITNNSQGFLADNPQKQKDQITQAIENAQIYNDNRRDISLKDSIADLAKENSELNNSGVQEALLKIGQDAYNSYDTKTVVDSKGKESQVRTTHQERLEHASRAMAEAAKNTSWTNSKKVEEPKVNPPAAQPVESQPVNSGQVEPEKPSRRPLPQENYSFNNFTPVPAAEAFLNEKTIFKKGTPYFSASEIKESYEPGDTSTAFKKEKNVKILGISSSPIYTYEHTISSDPVTGKTSEGTKKSYMIKVQTEAGNTWLVPLRKKYLKDGEQERDRIKKAGLPKFENGGEIDFTGLAWVDGSKNKPEHIFNAEQMDFLKQGLTNNVNLTSSLVSSLNAALDGLIKNDTYSTINNDNESIIIEHAEVNVNVDEISSDYDARRLGQEAMAEMVRIARKSGNRYVSRR